MGGEFQFGNGTAMFLPLELNLNRLIYRERSVFWLEQWGSHQNEWFLFFLR
jgi:hypothetical protein